MSAFIVGSTGLCGNFIVKHSPDYFDKIYTLSRSVPTYSDNDKITVIAEKDSTQWASKISELQVPQYDSFFSGLGTTRAKAGGVANQYKIDHDLNLELAKAAKAKGFKQYVLISSMGASASSMFPYMKMKGELEDHVLELGFEQTIILRPGVLLGERTEDKGLLNNLGVKAGSWFHGSALSKYAGSPIYGEEVALAALKASKKNSEKVLIISGEQVAKWANE